MGFIVSIEIHPQNCFYALRIVATFPLIHHLNSGISRFIYALNCFFGRWHLGYRLEQLVEEYRGNPRSPPRTRILGCHLANDPSSPWNYCRFNKSFWVGIDIQDGEILFQSTMCFLNHQIFCCLVHIVWVGDLEHQGLIPSYAKAFLLWGCMGFQPDGPRFSPKGKRPKIQVFKLLLALSVASASMNDARKRFRSFAPCRSWLVGVFLAAKDATEQRDQQTHTNWTINHFSL